MPTTGPITGSFTATGQSSSFGPKNCAPEGKTAFNFSLWGTFVGTVLLERSFDGGTIWIGVTIAGTAVSRTAPCSEVFEEPEPGVMYRANCSAYTSGTINYRLSR